VNAPTARNRIREWVFTPYASGTGPDFRIALHDLDEVGPQGHLVFYRVTVRYPSIGGRDRFTLSEGTFETQYAPESPMTLYRIIETIGPRGPVEYRRAHVLMKWFDLYDREVLLEEIYDRHLSPEERL